MSSAMRRKSFETERPLHPWKPPVKWVCENVAETQAGQSNMRAAMMAYGKRGYCDLAAYGYRMTGDAINADRE